MTLFNNEGSDNRKVENKRDKMNRKMYLFGIQFPQTVG